MWACREKTIEDVKNKCISSLQRKNKNCLEGWVIKMGQNKCRCNLKIGGWELNKMEKSYL